ncbi:MAG: hypothetical protein AAF648_12380, partial [Pseudomonadota bacterium]
LVFSYHELWYSKRFNRERATELKIDGPEPAQLTGRDAHDRVRTLLQQEVDLVLWNALLVEQGQAIGQTELHHAPSLAQALDRAAGGDAATTPDDEGLMAKIQTAFEAYYSPSGGKERFSNLRSEVEQTENQVRELEVSLRELDAAQRSQQALKNQLQRRTAQLAPLQQTAQAAAANVQEAERMERRREELTAQAQGYRDRLTRLADYAATRAELSHALNVARQQKEATESARQTALSSFEAIAGEQLAIAQERGRQLDRLGSLETAQHRAQLSKQSTELTARIEALDASLKRIEATQQRYRDHQAALARMPLDKGQVNAVRNAQRTLELVSAQASAAGFSIALNAKRSLTLEIDGQTVELAADQPVQHTRSARWQLSIPGTLDLSVDPPRATQALEVERQQAANDLQRHLDSLGLPAVDAVETTWLEKQTLEAQVSALADQLEVLLGDESIDARTAQRLRLRGEREVLEQQRAALNVDPSIQALDDDALDGDALVAAIEAARSDREKIESEQSVLAERQHREEAQLRQAELDAAAAASTFDERTRQWLAFEARPVEEGEVSDLQAGLSVVEEQLQRLDEAADDVSTEARRTIATNAHAAVQRAEDEILSIRTDLAVVEDRLKQASADGRFERHAEATQRLEVARDTLTRTVAQASAIKRLRDTVLKHRTAERTRYLAPLRAALQRYGQLVFDRDFSIELNSDWRLTTRTLHGETLPYEQLSVGAKEQLSVLQRLAAVELTATTARLPLFLDDTLGYADPERLSSMAAALALAAEQGQIIVLTCDPGRFAGLGTVTRVSF